MAAVRIASSDQQRILDTFAEVIQFIDRHKILHDIEYLHADQEYRKGQQGGAEILRPVSGGLRQQDLARCARRGPLG